jgi:hypothetical protein
VDVVAGEAVGVQVLEQRAHHGTEDQPDLLRIQTGQPGGRRVEVVAIAPRGGRHGVVDGHGDAAGRLGELAPG